MKTNPVAKGKVLPAQPNNAGETRLEQRARELAEIRGAGHRYTEEDIAQARRELSGDSLPLASPEEAVAETGLARDPADPPSDRGHHVEDMPADDEQDAAARMAEEGVDEAQHDLMLAARRKRES